MVTQRQEHSTCEHMHTCIRFRICDHNDWILEGLQVSTGVAYGMHESWLVKTP